MWNAELQVCCYASPSWIHAQSYPAGTVIDPELQSHFQTVIGSLLYLTLGTRPDIAFAVTKLAQHAAHPSQVHFDKALYICRYLVGTKNYILKYDGNSGEGLIACTDSDWASDPSNWKSQSGYFLKLAGGAILWTSRAQKTAVVVHIVSKISDNWYIWLCHAD